MLVRLIESTEEVRDLELLVPVRESKFGPTVEFALPPDADIVILLLLGLDGLKPVRFLLPHQVYVDTLSKILQEHPRATQIVALPARSRDQIALLASWQRVDVVRCQAEASTVQSSKKSEVSGG